MVATKARGANPNRPLVDVAVMVLSLGAVLELKRESFLAPLLYALQLFSTLIHEISHGVVCILTGGSVVGFSVSANTGGVAYTQGGNPFFIFPAGYLGSAIFGSLVFYLSNRYNWSRFFAIKIGAFIILFTLLFGRPDRGGSITAHIVAVGFGTLLLIMGLKGPSWLNKVVINIISAVTALEAILGAIALMTSNQPWHDNDAVFFSRAYTPFIPGNIIAAIWGALALSIFSLALYKSFHHGLKKAKN